ncbi:MAG: hypothetical protein R3E96_07715 [Planctomycetota bacterium]
MLGHLGLEDRATALQRTASDPASTDCGAGVGGHLDLLPYGGEAVPALVASRHRKGFDLFPCSVSSKTCARAGDAGENAPARGTRGAASWINPGAYQGPLDLAGSMLASGHGDAALQTLLEAEEIRPDSPALHSIKARVLDSPGRRDEAGQRPERAVELDSGNERERRLLEAWQATPTVAFQEPYRESLTDIPARRAGDALLGGDAGGREYCCAASSPR